MRLLSNSTLTNWNKKRGSWPNALPLMYATDASVGGAGWVVFAEASSHLPKATTIFQKSRDVEAPSMASITCSFSLLLKTRGAPGSSGALSFTSPQNTDCIFKSLGTPTKFSYKVLQIRENILIILCAYHGTYTVITADVTQMQLKCIERKSNEQIR